MLTVMPGVRWDYSSEYGSFVTPRLHVKYSPSEHVTLRASAGKGYRSPHAIAENVSLLASGKTFIANEKLKQEEAWNAGASLSFNIPVAGKELELNIDYYYTDFENQMVLNPYSLNHENKYIIGNLSGKSQCRDFLKASWRHHGQIPGAQGHHHQVSASRQFVEQ